MRRGLVLLTAAALALAGGGYAESPLSALGYGLQSASAGPRAAGMGQVSLGVVDTIGLNLFAPAFWDGGAQARFGFHGAYVRDVAVDAERSVRSDAAGLGGLAIAVPLGGRRFFGMALTPLTRMDYRWQREAAGGWTPALTRESGTGGISQVLLALALPVRQRLRVSLGARAALGTINRDYEIQFPWIRADSVRSARRELEDRVTGVGWSASWQWDNALWIAGGVVNGPIRARVQEQRVVSASGQIESDETHYLEPGWDLPWSAGAGLGLRLGRHIAAGEINYQGWGGVKPAAGMAERFRSATRVSGGWEWSPEYRPLDPFWKSLSYRAGLYLQQHYVESITGHQGQRLGLTGGLSVPYFQNRSRLDLALEFGWMGSRSRDLVGERTVSIIIGINHIEPWFEEQREKE
jgi:hypothetical protein